MKSTGTSRQEYVLAVRDIIATICRISDRTLPSNDPDGTTIAESWTEVMIDLVPLEGLDIALRRAFRDKTDSYAINAMDLKLGWEAEQSEFEATFERLYTH